MQFTIDTASWTITPQCGDPISWFDDAGFDLLSLWWLQASWQRKHSYQFQWLGRPIIQQPADVLMMQDLIHRIRPTVIIETGIAHGGSLVFSASMLRLIHDGLAKHPRVLGIDIEIRPHNRAALDAHPLRSMLHLIESSSIDPQTLAAAKSHIQPEDTVLVVLDSNHARDHVRRELELYAPLVSPGSAIIVMDGIMPALAELPGGTPSWRDDNPVTAINAFLQSPEGRDFAIDDRYDAYKLTHSPRGVLVRRSD